MIQSADTAFVFPGQGSQYVGMGEELARTFHMARQTFEEADDILGFKLSELCFSGPEDTLTETSNAQPALYVCGVAALRVLYEEWQPEFRPALVAGHSLGELTALTAAGALSFADGLRLVRRRGELMRDADTYAPGGMAALLGPTIEQAEEACAAARKQAGGVVVVANDNCPGQVVIAGEDAALALAMEKASDMGAKRVMRLPVSIAAHSPLMAPVQEEFRKALAATPFHKPLVPIIGNTQASILESVEDIREELANQLTSQVRWTDSVRLMLDHGVTTFIELGSKNVLSGLLRRIDRGATGLAVDTPEGIHALKGL